MVDVGSAYSICQDYMSNVMVNADMGRHGSCGPETLVVVGTAARRGTSDRPRHAGAAG
jgi:hypothetical protein